MKKYLIPMIALLLASCEQNNHAQNPIASQAPTTNAECKNLHKVLDIDDLLYQMYSNIDSHCLFEMPTAELEKIWGIPIVTGDEPNYDELLTQINQQNTLYIFKSWDYVNDNRNVFQMSIEKSKLFEKHEPFFGGAIAKGQYPKLIPTPKAHIKELEQDKPPPDIQGSRERFIKDPPNIYKSNGIYYWENHNQFRQNNYPILYIMTNDSWSGSTMPIQIIFQQKKKSFYLN